MSVPAYNRSVGELQVFARVRKLLTFTLRTVRNERYFKKRYYDDLGAPIVELTRRMMHGVYEADTIDADIPEGLERRLLLQSDVARACTALQAELLIALDFDLPPAKLREWTVLLTEFIEVFSKWRKSDQKKLLGR